MPIRINPSFVFFCPEGGCDVTIYWGNRTTQGACPCCGTMGDDIAFIETTPKGGSTETAERIDSVGWSGIGEIESRLRVLHEAVGRLERLRDHDGEEEGQPGLEPGILQIWRRDELRRNRRRRSHG